MRMRKKKNGAARLSACAEWIADRGVAEAQNRPVYIEIGAGKGGFACETARRHPDALYFAMERVSDCAVLAAERAAAQNQADGSLENLRFLVDTADNLALLFAPGTVDRIYLNFSDPWPKKGYAKRRLTHRRYLSLYLSLLKDGGRILFKTDNTGLFDFTLEEIAAVGLSPAFVTRDLHASERAAENVMTEYETAFCAQGMKICMLELTKPAGFAIPVSHELTEEGRAEDAERHKKSK